MATIDKKLNLVLTYPRDGSAPTYVHSTAISLEVFKAYYLIISRAFASIYTQAGSLAAGPRIAALELERAAKELDGDVTGLKAEMVRLSSFVRMTDKGWEAIPLSEAFSSKLLDAEEISEVENGLAFFTVASRMHRKQDLTSVLGTMTHLWGARIVSSNSTEFTASLPKWTPAEITSGTVTA
jgi:hypothetical protein